MRHKEYSAIVTNVFNYEQTISRLNNKPTKSLYTDCRLSMSLRYYRDNRIAPARCRMFHYVAYSGISIPLFVRIRFLPVVNGKVTIPFVYMWQTTTTISLVSLATSRCYYSEEIDDEMYISLSQQGPNIFPLHYLSSRRPCRSAKI